MVPAAALVSQTALKHFREYRGPRNPVQSGCSLIEQPRGPCGSVYTFHENALVVSQYVGIRDACQVSLSK
jgi:hypothetical protein